MLFWKLFRCIAKLILELNQNYLSMDLSKRFGRFTKLMLIIIIIVFLFVSSVHLVLNRKSLVQFIRNDWKTFEEFTDNYGIDNNRTDKNQSPIYQRFITEEMVSAIISIIIVLESIFDIIYLYFIINDKFYGTLVMTILTAIVFCYSLTTEEGHTLGPTSLDMTLGGVQIAFAFAFVYQIKPMSHKSYAAPIEQNLI